MVKNRIRLPASRSASMASGLASAARATDDDTLRRHVRGGWHGGDRSLMNTETGFVKNATEGMATPAGLPVWTVLLAGAHRWPWALLPAPAAVLVDEGGDAAV